VQRGWVGACVDVWMCVWVCGGGGGGSLLAPVANKTPHSVLEINLALLQILNLMHVPLKITNITRSCFVRKKAESLSDIETD
jgi:hypothetical protein